MKFTNKRFNNLNVETTAKGYDDISEILDLLGIKYSTFTGKYNCDLLFINCNTSSIIDSTLLRKYVEKGGVVYASDWANKYISKSFPNVIEFSSSNKTGVITATVIDYDLKKHIGDTIEVNFDMGGWKVIKKLMKGKVILLNSENNLPIMVEISIGNGKVYYTSFHNHGITTENEEKLLQLLIIKQVGQLNFATIEETAIENNIDLNKLNYKKKKAGYQEMSQEELIETPKFKIGNTKLHNKFKIGKTKPS